MILSLSKRVSFLLSCFCVSVLLLVPAFPAMAQAAASAPMQAGDAGTQASRLAELEKQVAANTAAAAAAQTSGDNAWMLVSAALVLMMSAPGWRCSTADWCAGRTSWAR